MILSKQKKGARFASIVLSVLIALTFMPNLGIVGAQSAKAADDVVTLDETWVNFDDNGDGTCTITAFNYDPGVSPTKVELPVSLTDPETKKTLTVKKIADGAFSGVGLTYVRFHEDSTITELGKEAFRGNSIEKVEANGDGDDNSLPRSVEKVGKQCFASNAALASMNLKDVKLKTISEGMFNASGIINIILPDILEKIETNAFYQSRLRTVKIPAGVTEIGRAALMGQLVSVDLSEHKPDSIYGAPWGGNAKITWKDTNEEVAENNNSPFLFDKESGLIYGLKDDIETKDYDGWDHESKALIVPVKIAGETVNGFACGTFVGRNGGDKIGTIEFKAGSNIKKIPTMCFYGCNASSIKNFPTTITEIELNGMRDMQQMEEIELPSVEKIDEAGLGYCLNLKKVTLLSNKIGSDSIDSFAFGRDMKLTEIHIPNMTKDTIKYAPWGATYAKVYWKDAEVSESTLAPEISEDGDWLISKTQKTILRYLGSEEDIVIPASVKVVGQDDPIEILNIGDEQNNILEDNDNISTLNSVKISDGISDVKRFSFKNTGLKNVDLGKVRFIAEGAFQNCNITNLDIPQNVTNIGTVAFANCGIKGELVIPGNIVSIGSTAFGNNPEIDKITVKMYRTTESDAGAYDEQRGLYKKALSGVSGTAPWGAVNAANNVYYMDEPRAVGKHEIVVNADNNSAVIKIKANTNNDFYIVKKITAQSGMPAVSNESYPFAQGLRRAATADMAITSKTNAGVQGGNGTYKVDMKFGSQIEGSTIADKIMPYDIDVAVFHTLTYNANPGTKAVSGTAPVASEGYVTGYKPALSGAGNMAIAGYTFAGWTTNANGGGTVYTAGSKNYAMPNRDATLYAKWNANSYDVEYNANGGAFKDSKTTKALKGTTDQELLKVTGYEQPSRAGYGFVGWARTQSATAANITTVPVNGTTVYAVWKEGTSDAILDANGGKIETGSTLNVNGTTGSELSVLTGYKVPTREGYTFKGWANDKNASSGNITTLPAGNGNTLYAIWSVNKYDVTFNANGGKIAGANTKKINGNYGAALTGMSGYAVPEREGYDFAGWATAANAKTSNIESVPAKNQTVYAVWQIKDDIIMTLDANGGTFTDSVNIIKTDPVTYGDRIVDIFDYEEPERDYYTFKGWSTSSDATSADIATVPEKDTTIYAVWEAKPATDADKTSAKESIDDARKTSDDATVSTDGSDVWAKDKWVTREEKNKLDEAIKNAEEVLAKDDATQEEIADALKDLEKAKENFVAAKKDGTKDAKSDIKDAEDALDAAKKAQDAANAAKKVADDAKKAADASGSADDAKKAAEEAKKAKELQDKAKEAADDAKNKADKAAENAEKSGIKDDIDRAGGIKDQADAMKKEADEKAKNADAAKDAADEAAKKATQNNSGSGNNTGNTGNGGGASGGNGNNGGGTTKDVINYYNITNVKEIEKYIPVEVTNKTPAPFAAVEALITKMTGDNDVKGSTYAPLKLQSKKQTKKSIKLQWTKVKGTKKYVIYGNQCNTKGKKYKMTKIATVNGSKKAYTVKKILKKKLKKNTNYKFTIVAQKGNKVIATAKMIHVRSAGHKKFANHTKVTVKKAVIKKAKKLKAKKTLALRAKAVAKKGKKVSIHAKVRYESTNKKIATVTKAGKVKGVKKGTCYIWAYAQNGIGKKIKVTVK